jgi:hypothetical protein
MLWGRLRALFGGGRQEPDFLPGEGLALLGGRQALVTVGGYLRGGGIGLNRRGYAVVIDDAVVCVYSRWFRWRQVRLPFTEVQAVRLERRLLSIAVEVVPADGRIVRLLVSRDRELLAARLAETARCGAPPAAAQTQLHLKPQPAAG